ncbi:MAG: Spy/CpxP family protein refolding chaperone [Parashewanella sp.]
MNKFTKTKLATLLLIGSSLLATGAIAGQGGWHHNHNDTGRMFKIMRKLDLSDQQKQQARELMSNFRKQNPFKSINKEERKAYADQIKSLVTAEEFDQQQAADLVEQRSQLRQTYAVSALKLRHDLYQILTPEQRQKAEQIKQRHQRH